MYDSEKKSLVQFTPCFNFVNSLLFPQRNSTLKCEKPTCLFTNNKKIHKEKKIVHLYETPTRMKSEATTQKTSAILHQRTVAIANPNN